MSKIFPIRLSAEEKASYQSAAAKEGMKLSPWLRRAATRTAELEVNPPKPREKAYSLGEARALVARLNAAIEEAEATAIVFLDSPKTEPKKRGTGKRFTAEYQPRWQAEA